MDNKDFNKEIKELRNKKGLSQEELANLSGLSLRTIQRIEKDKTNPLGDTKRKIIKILESYPDIGLSNTEQSVDNKAFLQKVATKWVYVLVIYIFSLFGVLLGFVGFSIFLKISPIIGFLCLIVLSISSVYHLKIKGWKKGLKYFIISISSIVIYLFIISLMIPVKFITIENKNGITTKIERNLITGKSDTTKTIEKIKKLILKKSQPLIG